MSVETNDDVVIVAAKRTAIGNFFGAFANTPAHELGSIVMRSLLAETKIDSNDISEVIMGQVLTAACGQNPARQAAIMAGIVKEVPAMTINQVCGSGLRAVGLAMQAIKIGESAIVIAGGQENMTIAPHALAIRQGIKMGNAEAVDTMIRDGLWDAFNNYHMGATAQNIADEFDISREEQDDFAARSQQKAEEAQKTGLFADEIVPVKVKMKKEEVEIAVDEFPRHGTTKEALANLKPAFAKDGTVTAGNASGINDGAAAVMVMGRKEAEKRKLEVLAVVKSFAHAGVEPKTMGTGPIPASTKALSKAGWKVADLDLIEANEAFAAQAILVDKKMGWNTEKVNINGGAIALGHPIGASGARILVTLLHSMKRMDAKKGLATLCVGGGMGVAICVERI